MELVPVGTNQIGFSGKHGWKRGNALQGEESRNWRFTDTLAHHVRIVLLRNPQHVQFAWASILKD